MTYQEHKSLLNRNPWAKLKVYKPGTWLSRGGWITVRGAEREIRNEAEYMAVQELQTRAIAAIENVFPKARLHEAIQVVIE